MSRAILESVSIFVNICRLSNLCCPEVSDVLPFSISNYVLECAFILEVVRISCTCASDCLMIVRNRQSGWCSTDVGVFNKCWLHCGGHDMCVLHFVGHEMDFTLFAVPQTLNTGKIFRRFCEV